METAKIQQKINIEFKLFFIIIYTLIFSIIRNLALLDRAFSLISSSVGTIGKGFTSFAFTSLILFNSLSVMGKFHRNLIFNCTLRQFFEVLLYNSIF